jgi:CBS domain containing-hemolysin-like protein
LVDGQTHVDRLADELDMKIPDGPYVTIAGFLMDMTGEAPVVGQIANFGPWELRIHSVDKRRIGEVVIERHEVVTDDDASNEATTTPE